MLLKNKLKKTCLLLLLCLPFFSLASEKILLQVNSVSQAVNAQFTLEQLLQLPQHEIRTNLPWADTAHTYKGPYLEDVLALANVSGHWITMYALDRYQIDYNFDRIKKYKPILALTVDRKRLTIRTKGPIWVILPMDDYAELDAAVYHDYMVWQLVKINVEEKSNDDAL
jgi:hypothetical protein